MSTNLVKNGTFLYNMEHWDADVPFDLESVFYEPGVGAPSPGCAILPEGEMFWQKIDKITKGKFEVRFRAKGADPDNQEFVTIEVQLLDNIFQAEQATVLPFGIGGVNLNRWIDYSAVVEMPDIAPVYLVFQSIEADGPLYIDSIELEPLPEELCPGLVHELQKRRRDFNAVKHPEERYREVVTQAVNEAPASLWETDYIDLEAEDGQYWYQLESTVEKPEHVKRILVHRIVGTDTEEEIIGRWTTEIGQDGHVYLQLDEATYDGCMMRVEYAKYPAFPECVYATTLPIDREWVLCHATTLLLMETDPGLEPPEFIDRDLQYWDAKRVAREAEIAPRPRVGRARTLTQEAYQKKSLPCGDAADIVGGPTLVPVASTPVPIPTADFHAEETESSYIPFDVQFRDDSIGSIIGWRWSFGDDTSSNEEEPLHSYTEGGLYSVTLDVINAEGRTHSVTRNQYINVGIPTANFEAVPTAGSDPWPVDFTDLSVGVITSWLWTFGDGETSTAQNPTHDYAATGNYSVTLKATGPTGSDTSDPQVLPVGEAEWMPPTSDFVAAPLNSSVLPADVRFSYTGQGATTWAWTFGDGGESDEQNPLHTYATGDFFTVGLTVTNAYGNDLETKVGYIVTGFPHASFDARPLKGYVPLSVEFRNMSTGAITNYHWSFGDGAWSSVSNPTHVYQTDGRFTVELIADGPTGSSAKDRVEYIQVYLPPTPPPEAVFRASPLSGDSVPLEVTFTDESTGDLVSWLWSFGDGETSTEQNPVHEYIAGGVYDVSLTVEDTEGRTSTMTIVGCITIGSLTVDFEASPVTGDPTLGVAFTNLTTGIPETYAWTFGDGGTSTERDPVYEYDTPGDYDVTLAVTGPVDDGSVTVTKVELIHVNAYLTVVAEFDPVAGGGSGEIRCAFINQSTGAETYLWDFDSVHNPGINTSAEVNPFYTFRNDTGSQITFTVKLTATGPGGEDIQTHPFTMDPWVPADAQFDAVATVGTAPFTVQFLNTSTYSESWDWDFDWIGDPGAHVSTDQHPIHIYSTPGDYYVKLVAHPPGAGADDELIREDPNGFIHVGGTPPAERVTDGLQVEYHFDENAGKTVHDRSTVGTPLDLTIADLSKVTWNVDEYLTVHDGALILSDEAAAKVITACKASNELTMEAWVTRGPTPDDSLFHIIMGVQSPDTGWWRNCAMGEKPDSDEMITRIRTSGSGETGDEQGPEGALKDTLIHLVVTRETDGTVTMYQDAQKIGTLAGDAGTFATWGDDYKLALANIAAGLGSAPWFGSLHLVAMYSKALSLAEVEQNFTYGGGESPPPDDDDINLWVSSGHWGTVTGDDDGNGSETDPWETLQVAVDRLSPGDTLGVLGWFHEQVVIKVNGTLDNRIRIVGVNAPQEDRQACIDGATAAGVYTLPLGTDYAGNPDFQCPGSAGDNGKYITKPLVKVADGGDYVTFENLEITRSRGRGITVLNRKETWIKDCYVHEIREGAIHLEGNNKDKNDYLVQGTTVFHGMNYCPKQRVSRANAPWAHSILAISAMGVTFRLCVVDTCYGEGMGMRNCNDGHMVNCTSRQTNNTGFAMNGPVDSSITHCFVSYDDDINPACGISINGETGRVAGQKRDADNVLVANNIIYGASPGIRFQHQTNEFYPLKFGIRNVSIHHNTIVHVRPPKLNPERFPGGVGLRITGNDQANNFGYENINIRNNLVLGTGEGEGTYTLAERGSKQMASVGAVSADSYAAITFSHNWWSYEPDIAKAQSPQDKIGSPTTGVVETDLSPTRTAKDAYVKDVCTAIGAGMNLHDITVRPVTDDHWGTERPSSPTMGAHEPVDE